MLFRRRSLADAAARSAALAGVLAAPTFELVPLKNALDQAGFLPAGATVSVTASPAKGIEATVALCEQLQAARLPGGPAPVGADGPRPGPPRRADRLARGRRRRPRVRRRWRRQGARATTRTGCRCSGRWPRSATRSPRSASRAYPQGHAFIADAAAARRRCAAKAAVRELHDDPALLRPERDRVLDRRAPGRRACTLPGPPRAARASPSRSELLAISARIGVADTHRFLVKNTRFVARLIRSGGFYRPDGLLEGLAPLIADPANGDRRPAPVHVQRGRRHRALADGATSSGCGSSRRPEHRARLAHLGWVGHHGRHN